MNIQEKINQLELNLENMFSNLWYFCDENGFIFSTLNQSWILPHSRYFIHYKLDFEDKNYNKKYDLINKDFKKVDDEKFIERLNKCIEVINPNGVLMIHNTGFLGVDKLYYFDGKSKISIKFKINQ